MDVNLEAGKRERESLDARDCDDGSPPPAAVKRAWSKPRVRLVTLSNVSGGTLPGKSGVEHGGYNPNLS